ncbi:SMODS domain-containing nucleotidyltransferase [Marinifilum sp.]|uniref:SMODS domain-containing nucleotidyltransferase n=1 Tax=Marinifilum sp. TaxID=2033137 RepID=UPI003BAD06B2
MRKLVTEDRKAYLDDILKRITESLQLNPSRRKLVEERYDAVSSFIEESEGMFHNAEIYAQGSYRLGTTVRPRQGEEYDLDFVVQINKDWQSMPFQQIYKEFKSLMKSNGNWEKLVKEKSRCIRLDYADEFHMDIIPTCTESSYGDPNRIMVPDKKEHSWVISNPEGYAKWFENKYISQSSIYLHNFYEGMEIRAAQELPKDDPNYLKQPLQHAVQLIKRYRDIYFERREHLAPSSIVLTTLVGQLYNGEDSIYETMNQVIERFELAVAKKKRSYQQFHISNPVLPEEIFTKEWEEKPELFAAFIEFIKALKDLWRKLNESYGRDLFELFKSHFGSGVFENAMRSQGEYVQKMRDKHQTGIHVGSGMAGGLSGKDKQKDKANIFHADL